MGNSTKTRMLREKIQADIKHSKQTTLDNPPETSNTELPKVASTEQKKLIEITAISTCTREDELALKVGFKLLPSRTVFSRVTSDLYFDDQKIDSLRLRILQGPLATDYSEFSSVLDMIGIGKGQHRLRVEMYELWSSGEKLTCATKEVTIEYIPLKREDRLINVPIVKSVAGADLAIVSDAERDIYREIDERMKKEAVSKRDKW